MKQVEHTSGVYLIASHLNGAHYALGEDGQVYKYEKQTWTKLNPLVEKPKDEEDDDDF
jgi:hypothetical protein